MQSAGDGSTYTILDIDGQTLEGLEHAIDRIHGGDIDGVVVRGAFSPEAAARVVSRLDLSDPENRGVDFPRFRGEPDAPRLICRDLLTVPLDEPASSSELLDEHPSASAAIPAAKR